MAKFTLHVQNLRVLRSLAWSPRGTSVLIGANGSGKTTVFLVLKLLRAAIDQGLPQAVTRVLGGSYNLNNWAYGDELPTEVGIGLDELEWRVQLKRRGTSVEPAAIEKLTANGEVIYRRDELGFRIGASVLSYGHPPGEHLLLRHLAENRSDLEEVQRMAAFLRSITVFHDPDLWSIRTRGSQTTEDHHLESRAGNALTMLRKWYLERPHRFRYQFVLDGLRAAFPGRVTDLDFKEAGQTLVMQVYRPGHELPGPLAAESNGFLQMLVLLCDLAAAEEDSVVAIDEPENALHPFAIREFLRRAEAWTQQRRVTLLLATHSPVLLDELTGQPDRVFVMHADADGPTRVDEAHNRQWLANFRIGELYADGELGSNDESR